MDGTIRELQTGSSCAACRIRKRRCAEKCLLAPYFPPTNPDSFLTTMKVFKASKIAKTIKDTRPEQRSDAVNSMIYEASVRKHDPVNGCAGLISDLEMHCLELTYQLAEEKEELNALQMAFHHSSITPPPPKVEVTGTIMNLICRTPEELDVQMDDIIMGEDNAYQSPNWEELPPFDLEEIQ
ncbi:hypothetical protein SUGI_0295200 [Cryptomeria japonica]|uniref:LOB domain-containing protein 25-like n=1 Tax=Cryptomeria japonica TaxID=3369 RepID=UPI002408C45C|nr:LOB domain-containing protein 25-like [Cryptomeria japonica]GLJ17061.1 hypothetical protein SUGI_0295200 [Cryptomeria japonica]